MQVKTWPARPRLNSFHFVKTRNGEAQRVKYVGDSVWQIEDGIWLTEDIMTGGALDYYGPAGEGPLGMLRDPLPVSRHPTRLPGSDLVRRRARGVSNCR